MTLDDLWDSYPLDMNDVVKQVRKTCFWKLVTKSDGCWIWKGGKYRNGYGTFGFCKGVTLGAHIFSYLLEYGTTNNLCVLHHCDVRDCVRPDHLFLGTYQDNMNDMVSKGRSVRGTKQWAAKLTEEDIPVIRRLCSTTHTRRQVAEIYGVTPGTITRIINKQLWGFID